MNPFTEKYKSRVPSDLLNIINNASDYQAEAVAAARQELERRQLSVEQLEEAKKEGHKKTETTVEAKLKQPVNTLFQKLTFNSSAPWVENAIKLLSVFIGGASLFYLISQLEFLGYTLFEAKEGIDSSIINYLAGLFYLPVAVWFFWKRKKTGWVLLMVYFIFSFITLLATLYTYWTFEKEPGIFQLLDTIVPPPSPYYAFYYLGILSVLCTPAIRSTYKVSQKYLLIIIGLTVLISSWIVYPV